MTEFELKYKIEQLQKELGKVFDRLAERGLTDIYSGPKLKYCKDCDNYKELKEFGKNEGLTGKQLQTYCRPCMSNRVKNAYHRKKVAA
jgi:hypothetical protein